MSDALFSAGDCHAVQGDGEICGTEIESPMTITLRLGLREGVGLREFQFKTPSSLTRADRAGYFVTTAHGPDLFEDAHPAVRAMIDHLEAELGRSRSGAYMLCSAPVDRKISEIVDVPNPIVSAYLPQSIFVKAD